MSRVKLDLELDADLVQWIQRLAADKGLPLSEWMNVALRNEWLDEYDKYWFVFKVRQLAGTYPTLGTLTLFCRKNGIRHVNPTGFLSYYQSIGWVNAKGVAMADWQSAVRAWEYILSGMCREDVEKLELGDPRGGMWQEANDGEVAGQECTRGDRQAGAGAWQGSEGDGPGDGATARD